MNQGKELQTISFRYWPVLLLARASVSAFAADARERGFIRKGMAEGGVVLKIGQPDRRIARWAAWHRLNQGKDSL